jgi:hypothetical protein
LMSLTQNTLTNTQTKDICKTVERHYAMANAAQKPVLVSVQQLGPLQLSCVLFILFLVNIRNNSNKCKCM